MEKKNVNVLLPTVDQLRDMREILLNYQKYDYNPLVGYCSAKVVEWIIANGGLENNSLADFTSDLEYMIIRSVGLLYPEELKYVDLKSNGSNLCVEILDREKVSDGPTNLDDIATIPEKYKKEFHTSQKIISILSRELQTNPKYLFEHIHDSFVRAVLEGRVTDLLTCYVPKETLRDCINVEPLGVLKIRKEEFSEYSDRKHKEYVDLNQARELSYAMNNYANRYKVSQLYDINPNTDLFDDSISHYKSLVHFIKKHTS